MAGTGLKIEHLSKAYGKEVVLRDIHLTIGKGNVISILGKSGSGKTTLLKIIAGLEKADKGDILWEGNPIGRLSPQERGIVYLYQEPLLFPHMSVFENIAFGLRIRHVDKKEIDRRVRQAILDLELSDHLHKMPNELSGGQRQRVSFGRALIIEPKMILLDEPFGALDHETREQMQGLLQRVLGKNHITAIFVTHDIKEAIQMASAHGRMQDGSLQIYDSLQHFLDDPATGAGKESAFWQQFNLNDLSNK